MPLRDPSHFFDRELSWLDFNRRVLEEALDPETPLLERLKFLGITANNLDEFFMIRVSGVQEQILAGVTSRSHAGYAPQEQYELLHQGVRNQFETLYRCFREDIVPTLEAEKIGIARLDSLSRRVRKELRERFDKEFFPVLTPLAVDSSHPFPRLKGLSLNIILQLDSGKDQILDEPLVAIVPVPTMLPRLVEVAPLRDRRRFVLLEDVIIEHVKTLFPGLKIREAVPFRLTRDADVEYKEIDADDLLKLIESEIRERERGQAVRLEIDYRAGEFITEFLARMLGLEEIQVYRVDGPLALNQISSMPISSGIDHLKFPSFAPNVRKNLRGPGSIFSKIRNGDILLHHPFESFAPVVDFIRAAAEDPKVLAIKQTLYRTSGDSPIIKSLVYAAENGKQVAALVELKARFDEENNIVWAKQLEEAGVHVIYGLVGLKTHSKCCMVVRREKGQIRRYVHLSTGNYNPTTARLYTDIGFFTCDPGFCDDASELFNMLTGYSHTPRWHRMIVAPTDLREAVCHQINVEREKAEHKQPARIRAKMNSLVDPQIITELYKASRAGVKIDLNVRGICCLKPGVKGVSDNIRVWSIVDRFLEHSRIYCFGDDAHEDGVKVFLSSADWMERNMDRRIEVLWPVLDPNLARRLIDEIFMSCAKDNVKARYLGSDGSYRKPRRSPGEARFRVQEELMKLEDAERAAKSDTVPTSDLAAGPLLAEANIAKNARVETVRRSRSRRSKKPPTPNPTPAASAPGENGAKAADAAETTPSNEPQAGKASDKTNP